jgi:hypothetical protein
MLKVLLVTILRVLIVACCTLASIVGVIYLARMLQINESIVIPVWFIIGFCGFIFGVYWAVKYVINSGYIENL